MCPDRTDLADGPPLLDGAIEVVNIGLESFAQDLASQGVPVIHVEWSPPAGGDPELADLLSKLGA
jgi:FdrA protein